MNRACRAILLGAVIWLGAAVAAAAAPDPSGQIMVLLRLPPDHISAGSSYAGSYGDGLGHGGRLRIAGQIAREHGLTLIEDWPMPVVGVECFVMRLPRGRSADIEVASLLADKRVDSVEPIQIYESQAAHAPTHNDPLFRAQPAARAWRLADLHQLATGRNVRVAAIDSTIDARQPDLAGQVLVSRNFVTGGGEAPEQHGTAVAGVIAAIADNGEGIAGVAPHAKVMGLRACWQLVATADGAAKTICDSLSLAKALDFAIGHGAEVINLSLSGPQDALLGKLLDAALLRKITVVAAFDGALPKGGFPASHSGVVAVSDALPVSNVGGIYVAPGRNVPTTEPGGRWSLVNGSSYAAAHVSGLMALARELNPAARGAEALVLAKTGGGQIDACATLLRAAGARDTPCAHAPAEAEALAAGGGGGAGRSGLGAGATRR